MPDEKNEINQEVVDKEPEKKNKGKKIKSIIEWVVSGIFIATAAVLVGFRISQKNKATPIFGNIYPIVLTDSMEPDYKVNDVLVVKQVDPSTLKVGDDITFYWDLNNTGNIYPVTHRISSLHYYEDTSENNGFHYTFATNGINKHSNQCGKPEGCDITWQTQVFHEDVLIGKVVRKSLFLKMITSVWGLIVLILTPTIYLMVTIVVDMFKKLEEQEKEAEFEANGGAANPLAGFSKGEIEQLKKEMLDEMLNKGKK